MYVRVRGVVRGCVRLVSHIGNITTFNEYEECTVFSGRVHIWSCDGGAHTHTQQYIMAMMAISLRIIIKP